MTHLLLKRKLWRIVADPELNDDDKVGGGCGKDGEEQGLVDGEESTPSYIFP